MVRTQEQIILDHLQKHGEITCWDAITEYHITRCPEMIRRLKKRGHRIISERVIKKKGERTITFARYILKDD